MNSFFSENVHQILEREKPLMENSINPHENPIKLFLELERFSFDFHIACFAKFNMKHRERERAGGNNKISHNHLCFIIERA
jgi:hypothetical protein